jgi:hypothetical protein
MRFSSRPKDEIRKKARAMVTTSVAALVCASTIALGFGWVVPVNGVASSFFDVLAVGSAVLFVGLLDGR